MDSNLKSKEHISVSEMISSFVAFSFVISVCYEQGYFYVLGGNLFELLSTADIISSSIRWLPWPISFAVLSFVLGITLQIIEGWLSEDEIYEKIKTSKHPVFDANFRRYGNWMGYYGPPICIVLGALFFGITNYKILIFPLFVFSVEYRNWIINHPRCPYSYNKIRGPFIFLLLFLPFGFLFGIDDAKKSIDLSKRNFVLVDGVKYNMLRKLSEGVLVQGTDSSSFKFIKNDDVESISYYHSKI